MSTPLPSLPAPSSTPPSGVGPLIGVLGLLTLLALVILGLAALWYARLPTGALGRETLRQEIDGAARASIELRPGAAGLTLSAGAAPGVLLEGTAQFLAGVETFSAANNHEGDTLISRLESDRPAVVREPAQWPQWTLRLNPGLPLSLRLVNGLPRSSVDLRGLRIHRLDVDARTGHLTLTLPERGVVQARVQGGSSEVRVRVPTGVALDLRAQRAGGGHLVIFGTPWPLGGRSTSSDYHTAPDRVALELIGGASRVVLERVQ